MANQGWIGQAGGSSESSNARQSGRMSGTDGAEALVQGSKIAAPGMGTDVLGMPSDNFEAPGQLSTCKPSNRG